MLSRELALYGELHEGVHGLRCPLADLHTPQNLVLAKHPCECMAEQDGRVCVREQRPSFGRDCLAGPGVLYVGGWTIAVCMGVNGWKRAPYRELHERVHGLRCPPADLHTPQNLVLAKHPCVRMAEQSGRVCVGEQMPPAERDVRFYRQFRLRVRISHTSLDYTSLDAPHSIRVLSVSKSRPIGGTKNRPH